MRLRTGNSKTSYVSEETATFARDRDSSAKLTRNRF